MSIFDSKDPILLKIVMVFLIGLMLLKIYYSPWVGLTFYLISLLLCFFLYKEDEKVPKGYLFIPYFNLYLAVLKICELLYQKEPISVTIKSTIEEQVQSVEVKGALIYIPFLNINIIWYKNKR